jgi:G:T-mismatch repair DNA endonuclease (very short patch repair protein)
MTGRICKPETRAKISASLMGHKGSQFMLGRRLSKESIIKRTLSRGNLPSPMKGKHHTNEARHKISLAISARPSCSAETRAKLSRISKNWHKKHPHPLLGKHHPLEVRQSIREASIKRWANPIFKKKVIEAIVKASFKRPTLPEKLLCELLDELCSSEYKYTGDGSVAIGGCVPDFLNVNGQKKVIELFGDYWHSKSVTGKSNYQEEFDKIKHYEEYGFGCLMIWEHELKDKTKVAAKILAFNKIKTH